MTYRGHLVGGAASAIAVCYAVGAQGPVAIGATGVALFASLLPDIDHPGSWLGRRLLPLHYLLRWLLSNPLTWMAFGRKRIKQLAQHRGFTHTLLAMGIMMVLFGSLVYLLLGLAIDSGYPINWFLGDGTALSFGGRLGAHMQSTLVLTLAFVLGYASHILLDMMTVAGVQVMMPWSTRKYHLLPKMLRVRVRGANTHT